MFVPFLLRYLVSILKCRTSNPFQFTRHEIDLLVGIRDWKALAEKLGRYSVEYCRSKGKLGRDSIQVSVILQVKRQNTPGAVKLLRPKSVCGATFATSRCGLALMRRMLAPIILTVGYAIRQQQIRRMTLWG